MKLLFFRMMIPSTANAIKPKVASSLRFAFILDLARSLGCGSHEASSRAFKQRFGQTPESVRAQGHADSLNLTEANRITARAQTSYPPAIR